MRWGVENEVCTIDQITRGGRKDRGQSPSFMAAGTSAGRGIVFLDAAYAKGFSMSWEITGGGGGTGDKSSNWHRGARP